MIEVKNLYKSFDNKEVLHDINCIFEDGKTNLIIGQSGSGKTVLMKNLVGLLYPTSGQVLYDGRDFVQMNKKEQVSMRREMGMMLTNPRIFGRMTYEAEFTPMISRASNCCEMRINPISEAMFDPTFPARIRHMMEEENSSSIISRVV